MSDSGFITNAAEQTGITTAYNSGQGIALTEAVAADANSVHGSLPAAGAVWSHLRLVLDETVGTTAAISAFLTWDAAGNDIAAGPTQSTFSTEAGLSDTSLRMVVIPMDNIVPRMPASGTQGQLTLWLKTDAGTVTCPVGGAELHWYRYGNT